MNRLLLLPARSWALLRFSFWYLGQFVQANLAVARYILAPRPGEVPGIVRVPLRSSTENHLAWLTGLVSLTPGTLVLEVDSSLPAMYVHGLQAPDAEALRHQVQDLEERLLAVVHPRPSGGS